MSDSVVKLRIDSKEYDANIKRAGQALTDYFNKVKEGGGTLKYLDEGVLEAVQAMGKLGTQASSVRGGLRELTQATSDMTVAYRALTDEENEISIAKEFDVYGFVYNLQEEAHRFAVKSSQNAKKKTLTHSILEKIEGIGPAKARALLSAMPLGKIKSATAAELSGVKGIGEADAKKIVEFFSKKKK